MNLNRSWHNTLGAALMAATIGLAPTLGHSASKADEYFNEARSYLSKGEPRSAIIQLKNALQRDPSHIESRLLLGTLYLRTNDGPAAEKEFGRAGQLGAEPKRWLLGYGQALLMQNKHQEVLDKLLPDESLDAATRASVLAMRGQALLAQGERDKAVEAYDEAIALDANNVLVLHGRVQMLIQDRKYDEALVDAAAMVAAYPDNAEGQLIKAELHRQLKQLDLAETHFKRAIELAAGNLRGYVGLGLVHVAQGKADEALADVEAMRKRFKDVPFASYIHALAAYQKGDLDTASEQLQLVLRAIPDQMQAQLLYGVVNYAQGKYQLAEDYLSRIHSQMPNEVMVAKLLAATRLKLNEPQRAITVLERLTANNPKDAQLMALLGTAYMQAGNNTKSAEYMGQAVELAPDQALLRTQLALGQLASGDTPSAISELEQAVNLGQDVLQADVLLVLSHLKAGDTDKALEVGERLRQRMPDSPIPANILGLAYLAAKDFDKSREAFEAALKLDGNFLVAEMNLARLALATQQPEQAARHYQAILKKQPDHEAAMLGLAALAQARGDNAEMEKWVNRAHEANPNSVQPTILLVELLLQKGEALKATTLLNGLPEETQSLPQVLRMRGMALIQAGQFSNAVRSLQQLVEKLPDYIEGWFQLGRAQAASGDLTAARDSFKRALELDAEHKLPLLLMALGELELKARRWDEALSVAGRLQEHFPTNPSGFELEAAAYRGMGRIDKALDALEKAVRVEGTSKRVNLFAHTLAAAGKAPKATYLLQDWLRTHPEDAAARSTLGLLQQQAGQVDEAIASYQQVLKDGEPNPVIFNNLAWLYLKKGDPRAEEYARKAYDIAPERAEIVDTYGWVMFSNDKRTEGMSLLQQALVLAPRNPEIGLHVAEALHRSGRDKEARPLVERIIADHPNTQWAVPAKELRDQLKD
jgi:putative PEP-CTERM system TPR-repeat lipoprotein